MKQIALFLAFTALLFADLAKTLEIPKNSYAVEKTVNEIESIKVSDGSKVRVDAVKNRETGKYNELEIFAKEYGKAELLISFKDGSRERVEINVIKNLESARKAMEKSSKDVKLYYKDEKVVIDGVFESYKDKETLFAILESSDINVTKDTIDISSVKKPPIMVRAKLYVVELTNKLGHEYQNGLLLSAVSSNSRQLNTNPAPTPPPAIAGVFDQSVTLSGGLTAIAGILGPNFNLQGTLSYLKTKNLAKILDETTVSVLENKEGKFHAGGTIYVTTQSISSSGTANTQLIPINYGVLLSLKANTIMNGGFVNMTIHTESSKLDNLNKVLNIPGILTKRVDTNVIAKNKSVIVLGGMINSEDSKAIKSIPILGDIPILGKLFKSESFVDGQSELAFFIVPEIVDASEKDDSKFMKETREEKEIFLNGL